MPYFLTFDVETLGLYGSAFAIGFVVTDGAGIKQDEGIYVAPLLRPRKGWKESHQWVQENVFPVLPPDNCATENDMCHRFMQAVAYWKEKAENIGERFYLVSDVAFPCEANFLLYCQALDPERYTALMPYPLLDVSSILFAAGSDPVGTYDRTDEELPAHNPLNDARQSSRILHMYLSIAKL